MNALRKDPKALTLAVEPGRIIGAVPGARPGQEEVNVWTVPCMSEAETEGLIRSFAEDVLLYGGWCAKQVTALDLQRAGLTEAGWHSSCSCAAPQPCRHAQSALFRYREMIKERPWEAFEVFGLQPEHIRQRVREARKAAMQGVSVPPLPARSVPEADDWRPPVLSAAAAPSFWNRETPIGEWLLPIYRTARRYCESDI